MGIKVLTLVIFALGINLFLGALLLYVEEKASKYLESHLKEVSADRATGILDVAIPLFYILVTMVFAILPTAYTPKPDDTTHFSLFWLIFFLPSNAAIKGVFAVYPPFAWLAPAIWGVGLGRFISRLKLSSTTQKYINLALGLILFIGIFIPIRYASGFGNINPELLHPPIRESIISFFNNVKYPPSIAYLACTLGINHLLLFGAFTFPTGKVSVESGPLMVYGGSSLAFFITHSYVYWFMAWALGSVGLKPEEGYGPLSFWICWAFGLGVEYVFCRWYSNFKRSKSPDSIWRFF
ncbi:hypothetical protein HDV05_000649 [Chytridiales sp. JEL 0842]|nr:hypothetical protein HDV05_000649 [Chytridiales sp. JEL 0842]